MDVIFTFSNGEEEEDIYTELPDGVQVVHKTEPNANY